MLHILHQNKSDKIWGWRNSKYKLIKNKSSGRIWKSIGSEIQMRGTRKSWFGGEQDKEGIVWFMVMIIYLTERWLKVESSMYIL